MEEFERVCCIREATMEIWEAATGEMYVRGSHGTFMINMLLVQKNLEQSLDIHHDIWQECGRSFCDEGVRLPHIACTIACIDHAACLYRYHLLHFLVRKSDCLQGQTGR